MGHNLDIVERVRGWLIPKIGWLSYVAKDVIGRHYYVEGGVRYSEYVASVQMDEEEFEEVLSDWGFVRNPLASLKRRFVRHLWQWEVEEGSWRYLYDEDWHIHVILFDGKPGQDNSEGEVHVFAHKEYRWDKYPKKHYFGIDFNPQDGVDYMMNKLFSEDIPYVRYDKDDF